MPKSYFNYIVLVSLTLFLCACAPYGLNERRAGMCNTLNSEMIFGGATSNTRNADIQRAQAPLIRRSYDDDCYQNPVKKKYS